MACANCDSLPRRREIRVPNDLREMIRVASEAIAAGHLRELPERADPDSGPFANVAAGGPWGDFVGYAFKCTGCGNSFRIQAETYHGRGGFWSIG